MSVKIRLARGGAKKSPYYRVVVADSRSPRDGKFIEKVGTHNPLLAKGDENRTVLKKDRIEDWLTKGAVPSERVATFLKEKGIGQKAKQVKAANDAHDAVVELKKVEIAAKKKAESEAKAAAEAEAKKKAEEEAKAAAEAEKEAKQKAEAEAASAESVEEEAPASAEEAPVEEAAEEKKD